MADSDFTGVKFSIILPTLGDRGLLLPYSVGSVLAQTETSFELLIIGDGVNEFTRKVIKELELKDKRIRFFDYPKHSRRGEPYRHEILTKHANGKYVAYILDRDLWLPNHLETLERYFEKANFVSSHYYKPQIGGSLEYGFWTPTHYKLLSTSAHTMALYKSLPFGWRTTPPQYFTDAYMWDQFAAHTDYKLYWNSECTVLYFKRGIEHPGIPTEQRVEEMKYWFEMLTNEDELTQHKQNALTAILMQRKLAQKDWIRIKGKNFSEFFQVFQNWLVVKRKALERVVSQRKSKRAVS